MKNIKEFLVGILCFIILFIVTGCEDKTAITSEDFKNRMESKGYIIQDATNQMSQYNYIKQVYLAISKDYTYQIEFYELSDSNYASSFFDNNKSLFKKSKSTSATETSVSMKSNEKYTLNTNGKFKVVSRIDNTVIYLDVDENYKSSVKYILDDIGY